MVKACMRGCQGEASEGGEEGGDQRWMEKKVTRAGMMEE